MQKGLIKEYLVGVLGCAQPPSAIRAPLRTAGHSSVCGALRFRSVLRTQLTSHTPHSPAMLRAALLPLGVCSHPSTPTSVFTFVNVYICIFQSVNGCICNYLQK